MIQRPTLVQQIGYTFFRPLPPELTDWVVNDVTGPGALRRYFARVLIPVIPLLLFLLFLPGPLWIALAMMALLFLPLVYFSISFTYVYRRTKLTQMGVDPGIADDARKAKLTRERESYEKRHGR